MVSALAYIHNICDRKDPTKAFVVKKILFGLRKIQNTDKRLPISYDILRQMVQVLPQVMVNPELRLLCQTMFVAAFFALLRIGEITVTQSGDRNTILLKNVSFQYINHKPMKASLVLGSFKHSQGVSATVSVKRHKNKNTCPVRLLHKYINSCNHTTGTLFKFPCGRPVTDIFFKSDLRECIQKCRLDSALYTPHSFRIGGATHAYDCNLSDSRIRFLGKWKSNAYQKYIRPSNSLT
ncbi:uncharacterized protein LOC128547836 [Mercenaria mercenaria]|uniref:uncharacterized protein LOC128547836 n=1 Tax=Mercenaria mercenaria TaxID=6596 RepID=UPI00234F94F4|nr:uncharacterized protein LOC128547836 [Mercenaria mercenaria]